MFGVWCLETHETKTRNSEHQTQKTKHQTLRAALEMRGSVRAGDAGNQVSRSLLRLQEDAADILGDDAEAQQLHGSEVEHYHHDAGPAARSGAPEQGVRQDPRGQAKGEEEREQAEGGHKAERKGAEADQAVDRQPEELG